MHDMAANYLDNSIKSFSIRITPTLLPYSFRKGDGVPADIFMRFGVLSSDFVTLVSNKMVKYQSRLGARSTQKHFYKHIVFICEWRS